MKTKENKYIKFLFVVYKWSIYKLGFLGGSVVSPGTASSEPLLASWSRQECRFPCYVWKGFPTFPARLRMRQVSRGNSRHSLVGGAACQKTPIPWSALDKNPMAEPNSKAILWNKAQHEGALTPWCIVQKNPQVPHTNRQVKKDEKLKKLNKAKKF